MQTQRMLVGNEAGRVGRKAVPFQIPMGILRESKDDCPGVGRPEPKGQRRVSEGLAREMALYLCGDRG
jgi:hypothetical protein